MSKIKHAFENKKAFIAFMTAGDPSLEKTEEFVLAAERGGADLIEIGIPFSDPIADGPVIQDASVRALKNNITTDDIFDLVVSIRKKTNIPLVFLTYLNSVFKYGYDKFLARCQEIGVDGLIIPDLPFEEKGEIAPIAKKYDVDIISLIAPTSEQRIQSIAKASSGFLYIVASMGVTGVRSELRSDLPSILEAVKAASDTPAAVGFGINTPEQAKTISGFADGVIVGSAIVKLIAQYGDAAAPYVEEYVASMKNAMEK